MTKDRLIKEQKKVREQIEQLKVRDRELSTAIEDMEKAEFWRTGQKLHISAEDLQQLVKLREKENKRILAEREGFGSEKNE